MSKHWILKWLNSKPSKINGGKQNVQFVHLSELNSTYESWTMSSMLAQVEEMLIARACPIMSVYRKHGGQQGYHGHILNLPQNINSFIRTLPVSVSSLPILLIRRNGAHNTASYFRVRQSKVLNALVWLKANNRFYHDIEIDYNHLSTLPEDDIPASLTHRITAVHRYGHRPSHCH